MTRLSTQYLEQWMYITTMDVVVRLSVHVHFNMGLSPRDSWVPGQHPSVCSIGLTASVQSGEPGKQRDAWHHEASCHSRHRRRGLHPSWFCSCKSPGVYNIRILVARGLSFHFWLSRTTFLSWRWTALTTAAVWSAWSVVFLSLFTIIGSTIFRCLVYSVSFICLSGMALVVMGWHTFPGSRHLAKYCADSNSECSLTFSISASVCRWSILDILWHPVAILRASFCVYWMKTLHVNFYHLTTILLYYMKLYKIQHLVFLPSMVCTQVLKPIARWASGITRSNHPQ